jgi:integrase
MNPNSEERRIAERRILKTFGKRLNKNSLAHVKSLLSGLFEEAQLQGLIDVNPLHGVKIKKVADLRAPKEKEVYSIEERDEILHVIKRLDAKVFFLLSTVLGLRPSEANCIRWENIDLTAQPYPTLKVREGASYGHMDKTKTEKSKRTLLIVEPLLSLLKAYAKQRGLPKDGLLFMRAATREVVDPYDFPRLHIKQHVEKAGLVWKGMYAGRHGVATRALNTPGVSVQDVAGILGNQPRTVMQSYAQSEEKRAHAAQLAMLAVEQSKA